MNTAQKIAILAGNPIVEITASGSVKIEPQIKAFEAALKLATETREQVTRLYLLFDHSGDFRRQFVETNLPTKTAKSPKLSDLRNAIQSPYLPLLEKYGVSPQKIGTITEGQCRMRMLQSYQSGEIPSEWNAFAIQVGGKPQCNQKVCILSTSDEEDRDEDKPRVTCKGITAEAIHRCASHADHIVTFWEFDPRRCKSETIYGGTLIARELFAIPETTRIEHNLLFTSPIRPDQISVKIWEQ